MRGEKTVFLMSKYQVHKGYMPYLFPDIMLVGFSPFNWETVKDILRGFEEGFEVPDNFLC